LVLIEGKIKKKERMSKKLEVIQSFINVQKNKKDANLDSNAILNTLCEKLEDDADRNKKKSVGKREKESILKSLKFRGSGSFIKMMKLKKRDYDNIVAFLTTKEQREKMYNIDYSQFVFFNREDIAEKLIVRIEDLKALDNVADLNKKLTKIRSVFDFLDSESKNKIRDSVKDSPKITAFDASIKNALVNTERSVNQSTKDGSSTKYGSSTKDGNSTKGGSRDGLRGLKIPGYNSLQAS